MDQIETPAEPDERSLRSRLTGLRLRFPDPALEKAYRADRYQHNVANIRFAFLAGIGLWVVWGVLLRPHILALTELRLDTWTRAGVFIPLLLIGFGLTFTRIFRRIWEWVALAIAIATLLVWVFYASRVLTLPAEYGYVGVILITAFTYSLLRLRFVLVLLIIAVGIAAYLPFIFTARYVVDVSRVLATLYLLSFGFLGALAAYRTERVMRDLFLRERELERERQRSDVLLSNILPLAVIEELKTAAGGRIAHAMDEVTVLFVDAVGSTEQAAHASAEAFASALDDLFRTLDAIATRHGLEKIKTIGDAYMAAAGAPVPSHDHAGAAVAMALDVLAECETIAWPSGEPIQVHGGVATGPAVAGVIGTWKIAYDLWGDTVNLASRLEEQAQAGEILVAEATAARVGDRFPLGPEQIVEVRGRGPTPARAVLPATSGDTLPAPVESS